MSENSGDPTDLIIGAVIAGLVGVVTALINQSIGDLFRRRRVARAVFTEMIQAINFFSAVILFLDQRNESQPKVLPRKIMQMLRPLDRHIVPNLGEALGYLSVEALANAMAFQGTLEADTRLFKELYQAEDKSEVSLADLGGRARSTLSLVCDNAEVVAEDAYWPWQRIPETNSKVIRNARDQVRNG